MTREGKTVQGERSRGRDQERHEGMVDISM
jgi:hypothetical protein